MSDRKSTKLPPVNPEFTKKFQVLRDKYKKSAEDSLKVKEKLGPSKPRF